MTLSLMVTGVTYRHPGLLAKIVTTLDVLSGGRAMLGIGAAWYEREHLALGVPFPPIAERFERLEETLQICNQMWSDDDGPFEGKHYQLAETMCSSAADSAAAAEDPHRRRRRTQDRCKLVARYADACNLFALGAPEVKRKLDILAQHCEDEGRDMGTIKKTIQGAIDPTKDLDGFLRDMEEYAKLGITMVGVRNTSPDPVAMARKLAEVVPRLALIGPS